MVVASGLHDVDLAAGGPGSVHGVDGHHPDGGPEPVALRDPCLHFDATIGNCCAHFGVDAGRLDRWDDGAVCDVRGCNTVGPYI